MTNDLYRGGGKLYRILVAWILGVVALAVAFALLYMLVDSLDGQNALITLAACGNFAVAVLLGIGKLVHRTGLP